MPHGVRIPYADSDRRRAIGGLKGERTKRGLPTDDLDQELAVLRITEFVPAALAAAPPLTEAQKRQVRRAVNAALLARDAQEQPEPVSAA